VVNDAGPADSAFIESGRYQVDVAGELVDAGVHLRAPYDPKAERVKA
jgi:hypothetical protein